MASRIEYFDILKGIGIVLVIIGHLSTIPYLTPFIYSVHMPLFFLISGYFFYYEKNKFYHLIKKSTKRYLLPYITTCTIILCLYFITGVHYDYTFTQVLLACIWGKATINVPYANAIFADFPAIGAIWFLLALFFADIFLYLSFIFKKWQGLFVVSLMAIGILSFKYIYLPFSIQSGMVSCIYLYIGHLYKKHKESLPTTNTPFAICFAFMLWLVSVFFGGVNIAVCQIKGFVIIGLIGSCCGVYLLHLLSQVISRYNGLLKSVFIRLGQITLFVLCIHVIDMDCLNLIYVFSHHFLGMKDFVWLKHCANLFAIVIIYSIYIFLLYQVSVRIRPLKTIYNLK